MKQRRLGNSDLQFTTVGIGTWAIGGGDWKFGWGQQDESAAVAAIVRGIELGINWIDTAAVYGEGRSELLVGQALRQIDSANRPWIATKCSRVIQPDGNIRGVLKRDSVCAECEASLRRLNVEAIDLYQLHWPDPDEDIEEAWQALADLVQQGKVRYCGVSNHSVAQMKRLQAIHPIMSLQPPYSMIARDAERELLPYCGQNQIGVIGYSPMCKGLLSGAFSRQRAAELPDSDHRSRDPKFQEPQLSINLQLVDGLRQIATGHHRTVAELAIAWVLRRPEMTSAIVGARSPDQIERTAPAADWQLAEEDIEQVETLLAQRDRRLAELGAIDTGRV